MSVRKALFGISGIILLAALAVVGQETQSQGQAPPEGTLRQQSERGERKRERMRVREGAGRRAAGMGRFRRALNLSDEQRQQTRAIMERRMESTRVQREELSRLREKRIAGTFIAEDETRAQALRQEIRSAMEGVRTEMAGVLTAEQKAKLEQLKQERKEKRELRRKERQNRLQEKPSTQLDF